MCNPVLSPLPPHLHPNLVAVRLDVRVEGAGDAQPQEVGGVEEEAPHMEENEAVGEQPVEGVLKGVGDGASGRGRDGDGRGGEGRIWTESDRPSR